MAAIRDLPPAVGREAEIMRRLGGRPRAVFLDYDGTLSPIVDDPARAEPIEGARAVIERLAKHMTVVVLSGRDLPDVRARVAVPSIFYAGSHGFDIAGPDGWRPDQTRGDAFLAALDDAERVLRQALADVPGALVERKRFAIAVHYRRVPDAHVDAVERAVDEAARAPGLRKGCGKKVFELRPATDWDKGRALLWMLEAVGVGAGAAPLFIGDDATDEDAFQAVAGRGVGIVVGDEARETAAHYRLADPKAVLAFLEWLAASLEEGTA